MNEIPRRSPYHGRYPQGCPHCGSEWFYGRVFVGVEGVQHRVIICLCGMPQQPVIGGVRGGRTPNRTILSFDRDFKRTQRIATVTKDKLARKEWESVTQRLVAVAKAIDDRLRRRRMRRQAGKKVPVSKRAAAGSGKDLLVVALQQSCGLTFDRARDAVNGIIKIWIDNLSERRPIQTPLGWIGVRSAPKARFEKRFGKQYLLFNKNPRRVWLSERNNVLSSPPPETPEAENRTAQITPLSSIKGGMRCPDCGGSYFTEVACRQYRKGWYSSWTGGQLRPLTDDDPIHTLVCLCTRALDVKSRSYAHLTSFRLSLEKAHAFRRPEAFEERLQNAAADLVVTEALQEYANEALRIEQLANIVMSKKDPKPAAPKAQSNQKSDETAQPTILPNCLTKIDLAIELSSRLNISRMEAEQIVQVTFNTIIRAVDGAKRFEIRGLGTFSARHRRARMGRNPRTRNMFRIAPKKTARFKPSKQLVKLVNKTPIE